MSERQSTQAAQENLVAQNQQNFVGRIAGTNRITTAVAVSEALYPEEGTADSVVLARADDFADGLAGGPLAHATNGPLLLTATGALEAVTLAEIQRVLADDGTVYVLGGTGAISADVVTALQTAGLTTERLSGTNRYGTAVAIAEETSPEPAAIMVTTGRAFPDALSAGPAATLFGDFDGDTRLSSGVVVLTDGDRLPAETADYLDDFAAGTELTAAIGGPAARAVDERIDVDGAIVGVNRYQTAALVGELFVFEDEEGPLTPFSAVITSGVQFPDALSGGVLASAQLAPVLLTPPTALSSYSRDYLSTNAATIDLAFIIGGSVAVNDTVAGQVLGAIR